MVVKDVQSLNAKYKTTEQFINESLKIHGNEYDYSLCKYKSCYEHVKIICREHGVFKQLPIVHLRGSGCPSCKMSKGEKCLKKISDKFDFNYECQKTFKDCKSKRKLRFDFYLSDFDVCVEYDGEQHFIEKEHFGGKEALLKTKERDRIKNVYCQENNIKLLRIPYQIDRKDFKRILCYFLYPTSQNRLDYLQKIKDKYYS